MCISANKSSKIIFNKYSKSSSFFHCHLRPFKKFQIITPKLYIILLLPSFALLPPSEILKMILPRLKNFLFPHPSVGVGREHYGMETWLGPMFFMTSKYEGLVYIFNMAPYAKLHTEHVLCSFVIGKTCSKLPVKVL